MLSLLLVVLGLFSLSSAQVNDRPIIGIFTQPCGDELQQFGEQYIAASYVKFIEGAGARVAPIRYSMSESEIEATFQSINGFLLPGGGVDFGTQHQYWTTLTAFYQLAIKANANGDYFPMWGTCMGFQELCLLQSQNMSLLSSFNSENYTVPLNFTPDAAKSRLFSTAPDSIIETLKSQPVTMNNHMYGVSPDSYSQQSELYTFFDVLSTNVDRDGKEFLSTIESYKYPIYGSQWHPEKPIYEWNIHEVINHSTDSVAANEYTATFFVTESRKSMHTFPSVATETAALIYNYEPVYIYNIENDFEQAYFFNATTTTKM